MIALQHIWTPEQAEFDAFAKVSGDDNAIHVDPAFCATTQFGRTVSHGMLIYTKLWGLLRRHDPALVVVGQRLMFPNPAFAGEALRLLIAEGAHGNLHLRATRQKDGADCLIGEATLRC